MEHVWEGAWRNLHLVNSQGCYFWALISYLGCRSWPPCPQLTGLHKQKSIAKKSKPDVPTANKSLPLWQTENELTSCTSCLVVWPKLSVTTFPLDALDETGDKRDIKVTSVKLKQWMTGFPLPSPLLDSYKFSNHGQSDPGQCLCASDSPMVD